MFEKIKNNFGFGCMRLPMISKEKVDYEEFSKMIDAFIKAGFNYFDTAHGYLGGLSETAIRDCLSARYPREEFILTNKLTDNYFNTAEDIRPFFISQLKLCGVDYFDFYLMHAQNAEYFEKFKQCRAYEQALELKREGKIKHFGISFHDRAEVLDQILSEYPQVEVVQIQLNYMDFDDIAVQSRKCYEVCVKHGKPVIVMEPIKGGSLVNLPEKATEIFQNLHGGSNASYAMRFAAGLDGILMVLSGMSNLSQMEDNIATMQNFKPLNEMELDAIAKVKDIFAAMHLIPCTACRYCTAGCPMNISIPDLFACMNTKDLYHNWNANYYYHEVCTKNGGKASDCIDCGQCEAACPQHLPIRKLLKDIKEEFEK
ncbi:MAG: aldo/keto reductase [Clostridia bacterium]|nr:aldo/keto reductase [Clostridia bacterium]